MKEIIRKVKENEIEDETLFIVTDKYGRDLQYAKKELKKNDYSVKVLNLINMENSNCYNPFFYIENPDEVKLMIEHLLHSVYDLDTIEDYCMTSADSFILDRMFFGTILFYVFEKYPKEERSLIHVRDILHGVLDMHCVVNGDAFSSFVLGDFTVRKNPLCPNVALAANYLPCLLRHPQISDLISCDNMELKRIGEEKTAIICITDKEDFLFPPLIKILEMQIKKYAGEKGFKTLFEFS